MAYPNPFELRHFRPKAEGGLVEKFLSTYESRQTRRNYRTDLTQFFGGENVGRSQVEQVGREDVITFLREKSSLARSTLKRKLETLRSFFEWLRERGVLKKRPIGTGETTTSILNEILQENDASSGEDSFQTEGGGDDQKEEQSSPVEPLPSENLLGTLGQEGAEQQAPPPSLKDFVTTGGSTDGEKPGGEGPREGEESGGGPSGLPQWIVDSAREAYGNLDLMTEQRVPCGKLPSALRTVFRDVIDSDPTLGLAKASLHYESGLSIQIYYYQDRDVIEARIQSDLLQRARDETSDSLLGATAAYKEISYLMERGWALPSGLRNKVLGSTGAQPSQNPTPEDCPVWIEDAAYSPKAQFRLAKEISGAFAEGFGISKGEEIAIRPPL